MFSSPKLKIVDITNDNGILVHAAYEGNLRLHNACVAVMKFSLAELDNHIHNFVSKQQPLLNFLLFLWKRKGEEKEKIIMGTMMLVKYKNNEAIEFDMKPFMDELSLNMTKKQILSILNVMF
ncbi:hypothetical protein QCD58_005011 [Enterobacter hormaechei]|nr:hypothetical protein [Enterobacter hormaechei]